MGAVPRLLALAALLGTLAVCTPNSGGSDFGVTRVSKPLPELAGETLQGGSFGPSDHAGKILVVNFWATWCIPCRAEQPALQAVHARYGDRVAFLGVDERDDREEALDWIGDFGVTYPSLFDPSGSYADDFGFLGLPDTYVVDASGTIRFVILGATNETELVGLLEELLAEPSPT